jgi:hypothetical protein
MSGSRAAEEYLDQGGLADRPRKLEDEVAAGVAGYLAQDEMVHVDPGLMVLRAEDSERGRKHRTFPAIDDEPHATLIGAKVERSTGRIESVGPRR